MNLPHMKHIRLTKRHEGLPVSFDAFDGKTYFGNLFTIKNRVASVQYTVPSKGSFITYLAGKDLNRINLA